MCNRGKLEMEEGGNEKRRCGRERIWEKRVDLSESSFGREDECLKHQEMKRPQYHDEAVTFVENYNNLRGHGGDLAADELKSGHCEGLAADELGGALVLLRANGNGRECRTTKRPACELQESRAKRKHKW